MDEPRWLTYRELAAEAGLSLPAAEARARRMVKAGRWRHRVDNEPPKAVRVLVTPAEIEAMRDQGTVRGAEPHPREAAQGDMDPRTINVLLGELKAAHEQVVGELRRRAEWPEAEVVQLRGDVAAERERTAAALGRVAEGLEQIRRTQATALEAVAEAKAEREAALARVEEVALRAGEAEARAAEAGRRAETAEARLGEQQRSPAEAAAADLVELEAARARAAAAEEHAAEARRRAEEAEHRATTANERLDRFQRERITRAQEAAARASEAAEVAGLEAEARRPLWRRIFRRRTGRAP